MINITLTGGDKAIQALNKWKNIEVIIYGWMKSGQVDKIMQKSFRMNFGRQGRPDKWQELSDETVKSRDYLGYDDGPILQRSGNLMEAVSSIIGRVTTGHKEVQMVWGIDQLSSEAKKKFGPNQIGKGRSGQDLPSRPMIGFQNADATNIGKSLMDWINLQIR